VFRPNALSIRPSELLPQLAPSLYCVRLVCVDGLHQSDCVVVAADLSKTQEDSQLGRAKPVGRKELHVLLDKD
jgi:hypothetical protein